LSSDLFKDAMLEASLSKELVDNIRLNFSG
jgi:hypothetical protein